MYHNLPFLSVFVLCCFTIISSVQLILPKAIFKTQITHPGIYFLHLLSNNYLPQLPQEVLSPQFILSTQTILADGVSVRMEPGPPLCQEKGRLNVRKIN